jgi:SAM-dependent methyltransferase
MTFRNAEESHEHSLDILNLLYEYDDFMESVGTVVDLGCGAGLDLEWWATATTRDDPPIPLNIRCVGVDILEKLAVAKKYSNISYQQVDFENTNALSKKIKFDVLWCHDAFQYCINPLETFKNWRSIANDDAMLIMSVPETVDIHRRVLSYTQPNGCYYHYSIVSLIHMLAINGWNCQDGFFKKTPGDPWFHLIVYKSSHEPTDPKTTTWYDLAEKNLLPKSAVESINRYGFVRQEDLVLPWFDKSLSWLSQQ